MDEKMAEIWVAKMVEKLAVSMAAKKVVEMVSLSADNLAELMAA